jgi:hypothetical protein
MCWFSSGLRLISSTINGITLVGGSRVLMKPFSMLQFGKTVEFVGVKIWERVILLVEMGEILIHC